MNVVLDNVRASGIYAHEVDSSLEKLVDGTEIGIRKQEIRQVCHDKTKKEVTLSSLFVFSLNLVNCMFLVNPTVFFFSVEVNSLICTSNQAPKSMLVRTRKCKLV